VVADAVTELAQNRQEKRRGRCQPDGAFLNPVSATTAAVIVYGRSGRNPVSCTVKPFADPPYVSPADGPDFELIRRPAWRTTTRDGSNSRSGPGLLDQLAMSITSSAGPFGGTTMRFSARVTPRSLDVLSSEYVTVFARGVGEDVAGDADPAECAG